MPSSNSPLNTLVEIHKPTYRQVCSGNANHAEVLRTGFGPTKITYDEIVEYFCRKHDPTTLDFQGADRGTRYRSAIFFRTPEQETIALRVTEEVTGGAREPFHSQGPEIDTKIEVRALV